MGHGHDRASVALEVALEPGHGLGVEMVRRLVEEKQVGRREEQPAEGDAAALAAGQRRHLALAVRQPQRVHRAVERLLEAPGVRAVDPLLDVRLLCEERVEVGVGLGKRGRDGVEAVEEVAQRAHAVLDVPADVLRGIELGLLREVADRRLRIELGDARRGLLEPPHDPEERRLARAVRPEDADLRAVQERQRDVGQHLSLGAVELVGPVHRVDDLAHGGSVGTGIFRPAESQIDYYLLALCDMRVLYLRNVPEEVGERLERLAAREGVSVSAFAVRELARVALRADNPALLAGLPDLGVDARAVVDDVGAGRAER